MGYYAEMTSCKFYMSAKKARQAWLEYNAKVVEESAQKEKRRSEIVGSRISDPLFERVQVSLSPSPSHLIYHCAGFRAKTDAKGNITGLSYVGNKYDGRDVFLKEIAPYVKDGSRLEFRGDDGHCWALEFRNGVMIEVSLRSAA